MKRFRNTALVLIVIAFAVYGVVAWYEYIFARHVVGVITVVDRENIPVTLIDVNAPEVTPQAKISFVIGIKEEKTGEIVTASSEDRHWIAAQPGQCVEAQYFPYPPWNLAKRGTYHNARLQKLVDCATK